MIAAPPSFAYHAEDHSYWLDGVRVPSVTQLLKKGELITGEAFMTEASRERGSEVHRLCAAFDLGAPVTADSQHAGYLAAYQAAVAALKPAWEQIEEAEVEPTLRFAGRIDRYGKVLGRSTVCEIKSAVKAKHHAVQTALQAILIAWRVGLPAEQFQRIVIYLKPTGRFSVEEHTDPRDFVTARKLIQEHCR